MSRRWYVVHAYSGFEQQVKRLLQERIRRSGLEESFGEVLVPTEEVVEMRAGQRRRSDRKFLSRLRARQHDDGRCNVALGEKRSEGDGLHWWKQ